jgi:transcription elongation factor GreA-like protein
MAYNKENLLKKIIAIQDTVLEHKGKDVSQKRVFEKYIRDQYHISYSTFNEYLSISAKTELKKLLIEKEQKEINEKEISQQK